MSIAALNVLTTDAAAFEKELDLAAKKREELENIRDQISDVIATLERVKAKIKKQIADAAY